jgi:hypothetical protein
MTAAAPAGTFATRSQPFARQRARDVLSWAGFGVAVMAILWPLGLTNRVLAGVDAFTYFQPYWAYRDAVLTGGHIPLWNPYLFLGVPFLANPQAAVLYPLHWPLMWLPAERALIWSALLHTWLAAGFTYTFARRSLGASRLGAWLAGLLYGLGGFALARVENINQLNAIAWLPALLWLYDETVRATSWRTGLRWGVGLTVAIALQLLAGHTQTAFVNLVGLGLYAAYRPLRWALQQLRRSFRPRPDARADAGGTPRGAAATGKRDWRPGRTPGRALLPLLALLPALLLVSAQLLPSLELNRLGLRTEGLPYRQAVSFSLQPRLLAQSLLPPLGGGLAEAFSSEGYGEFVAYVGITGLILAGLAVVRLGMSRAAAGSARPKGAERAALISRSEALVLLSLTGLFLGLGAYNPFYYLLWRVVPGFGLFRAPVRWLELSAIGLAVLAGIGLDTLGGRAADETPPEDAGAAPVRPSRRSRRATVVVLVATVALAALLIYQQWPGSETVALWAIEIALVSGGVWAARRWPRAARSGLVALACLELWVASRALPFTLATAPYVFSLRNAPAALLAETSAQPPAGRDRFFSMSDIRYDPGDLDEIRSLMAGALSADAIDRLVRGAKQTEVIAPNLSLRLQLPSIDGYDGGLLPTQDYGKLETLFLPPEERLPDGRMREQLRQIPSGRLLDLTGVRFVLTDKQNDLWLDKVYYDLEQAAQVAPGGSVEFDLQAYPRFPTTSVGIVSHLDGTAQEGAIAAVVEIRDAGGGTTSLPLRAGKDTAPGAGPAGEARLARPWPDWVGASGQDYVTVLELPEAITPLAVTVRTPPGAAAEFVLQGLSLIDERTGDHQSVTVSPRGDFRRIHSGDVKLYERLDAPGRAWLVHGIQPVADDDAALRLVSDPSTDPKQTVVMVGDFAPRAPGAALAGEKAEIVDYGPEALHMTVDLIQPGALVVADAFYPGWRAKVDGVETPIVRANLMFRAIPLAPGHHEVVFSYAPASWRWGAILSLAAAAVLVGLLVVTLKPARQSGARGV